MAQVGALLLLLLLVAGCGGGDEGTEPVVGPLPTGPDDPRAYTEAFMSQNPLALAQLEQLMVVQLEPTSAQEGDTCPQMEGVDCIPYVVNEPTRIELSIDADVEDLAELVLVDASGAVVLRQSRGMEASGAIVAAGAYRLELHHLLPGEIDAPEQTVFLHPQMLGDAGSIESDAVQGGDPSPPVLLLKAQANCVKCDFTGAFLEGEHFDGLDLSGSIFNRARVKDTTFRGATMNDCQFLPLFSLYPGGDLRAPAADAPWEQSAVDADFSNAKLSRTQWAPQAKLAAGWHFAGVFRGAKLDGSVWKGKRVSREDPYDYVFNPDFRSADLTDSTWNEELLLVKPVAKSRLPKCTFQGADLTRAKFNGRTKEFLFRCRFDEEPESGRVTILRGADLTRANLAGTPMAGADLSGAILDHTMMDGTDLTGATLASAKIPGVGWRGTILTNAVIAGITPATLNDMDLTKTNFVGVDFAGLDLTHTDLSKAVLDPAPRFTGAKLTDGVRGVNVSGHHFPNRLELFKGADLTGVDFSHTELFEAVLEKTTLNNAKLVGANLNFANLRGAKLRGATLGVQPGSEAGGATLHGAFMPDIDLSDADLRTVDLTGAHLYGDQQQTQLTRVRLDSATLANAICTGAHFSGTMNNTVFIGAQLVNTVFNDATLTGAKFDDAYLEGADFSTARSVTGAVLSNAAVSAAPGMWPFTEVDGTPFIFHYEATKLGALATDGTVRCPSGALGPCCPSGDLTACLNGKLKPVHNGPFPPVPPCVPQPPCYVNCITPAIPSCTPRRPAATPTPRPQ